MSNKPNTEINFLEYANVGIYLTIYLALYSISLGLGYTFVLRFEIKIFGIKKKKEKEKKKPNKRQTNNAPTNEVDLT